MLFKTVQALREMQNGFASGGKNSVRIDFEGITAFIRPADALFMESIIIKISIRLSFTGEQVD